MKGNSRLTTTEELRNFINDKYMGQSIFEGDHWAAVLNKDNSKDWVYIGNTHYETGVSFLKEYNKHPEWNDLNEGENHKVICYITNIGEHEFWISGANEMTSMITDKITIRIVIDCKRDSIFLNQI